MVKVGWLLMAIGFVMQVLVPLGVFGRPMGLIVGVPSQLALVFLGTWILVAGLLIVYFTWLQPYAKSLDRRMGLEE
ncbi:hypothetical protein [Candidatus Entotheonella palauensis]|uniref:Uncharacterized protein n=1 Tax=Candidatus Entotheonella gemina TaxID=1429439 RepID=W4M0S4_9BACT|nr:hypothetical protein [Candidatus Entotheonella palauensis]ETX03929.1 MAG: hypothetical protein ETSY2_31720 [Candidatus Entotheonella gemina]